MAVSAPSAPQPTAIGGELTSTADAVAKTQDKFAAKDVAPTVFDNGTVLRKAYSEGAGKVVTVTTEPLS